MALQAVALQAAAEVNKSLCCRELCDCVGSQRGRTGANEGRGWYTKGVGANLTGLNSHSTVSFWHTDALHKEGVSLAGGFRWGAAI